MVFKGVPKNFGYVLCVTTLGLVLLSILAFLYMNFIQNEQTLEPSNTVDYEVIDSGEFVGSEDRDLLYYPSQEGSVAKDESEQKIIKTASFDITVEDFDDTLESIRGRVKELGGLIVSANDEGVSTTRSVTITVKVPSSSLESFVEKVRGLATVVNSYKENSADITKSYQDLEARLKNEKALETRLVQILESTTKVSEVLEVQKVLSQTQQNIEMLESQIKYYDSQVDMSTVTISMSLSSEVLDVIGEKWQPSGVFKEALSSLVDFGKNLGTFVIWVVVFSPVLIAMYLVFKWIAKRVTVK